MIKNKDATRRPATGSVLVGTSTPDIEPVMTIREVEEVYGVPLGTLKYWRHHNRGPESFLRGGKVVYRKAVLVAYFAQEQASSTRGKAAS